MFIILGRAGLLISGFILLLSIVFMYTHYCSRHATTFIFVFKGFSKSFSTMQISNKVYPKLDLSLSPEQIQLNTRKLIESCRHRLDSIGSTPLKQCTFQSILAPLSRLEADYSTAIPSLSFPQYVHPREDIREACVAATQELDHFSIEMRMREDIFRVVKAVADQKETLDKEDERLLNKMLLEFRLNGLFLNQQDKEKLKTLRESIADLELAFSNTQNSDQTTVLFTKDELEGCPEEFLSSLEQTTDAGVNKYIVTMKYPDLLGVLRRANKEETRKRVSLANDQRCPENVDRLAKAIEFRAKSAQLLGFQDHREYRLAERMAKTPAAVDHFLHNLTEKLQDKGEEELKVLKRIKLDETESTEFHPWDFHFYANKLVQQKYSVDHDLIKTYFPMEHVVDEMLKIYEQVLSLKFSEVTDSEAPKWHSDVRLFAVYDAKGDDGDDRLLIGHVYFDLFPRTGKYTHAACFPLQPGCELDLGVRQTPVSAMVCNFTKPLPNAPSLLKHDEVVTFFHELGHAMHGMCAKTRHSRFHGTNTETDFVEAPSQMLENWCWEKDVLKRLSKHYQNGQSLPDDLIDKLIQSKLVNVGLLNLRQLFFARYDMAIHAGEGVHDSRQLNELYARLKREVSLIPQASNVWPVATWGHLMGGYDSGYYGYLWSLVFSADMFQSMFKQHGDIMSAKMGGLYRRKVLQPGGSKDGMDMLKDFLGREPTLEAFLRSIGL